MVPLEFQGKKGGKWDKMLSVRIKIFIHFSIDNKENKIWL